MVWMLVFGCKDVDGMIVDLKSSLAVLAGDRLGEAPAWDALGQRLVWVDHPIGTVHEARSDGAGGWREVRRWDLNQHVAAAIPRSKGGLAIIGTTDIFILDEAGNTSPFARIDADPASVRINDAKCDPQGRLWAGTLALDFNPHAALYRIDPDGTVTTALEDVTLSNGLAWSPDGSVFYYVDSVTLTIEAFDFDAARGTLDNRRTVVTLQRGDGAANGITLDCEGCIWVALTGGGEVRRYAPDGTLLARVSIATPGATSCAFGGSSGEDLFITSRAGRMPDVAITLGVREAMMENNGPEAGGVFVCRPGTSGAAATPFAG
jgi:sugar lactone lactonase YvrE